LEEIISYSSDHNTPKLFNSRLEAGLRTIIILDAFSPCSLDINEIALFDYFIVHTGDIGGPRSLHPDIASRTGEYLVRRRLIEDSIKLMHRLHLIHIRSDETGIRFEGSDEAGVILDLMSTAYNLRLKECARWLNEQAVKATSGEFEEFLRQKIGRWQLQFESDFGIVGGAV
jgi:hypothetical protein